MTARIAILTPDPWDDGYKTRWREVLANEIAPLAAAGLHAEGRTWTGAEDLAGFDLVLPLLAWGYHHAGPRWREMVEDWQRTGVRLANPPSVLCWNADKAYLKPLAEHGAPVVPTMFVDRLDATALAAASASFGSDRLIAKPRISASAWQTIRWSPGAPLDGGPEGAALIQPYLPAIETEGEISLLYFAGAFSHAIRKRPQPGEFRVQPEYRGIITPYMPAPDERAAAEAILARIDEDLLYARVDLIRDDSGTPLLMELELVEPDLYLEHDPGSGAVFAEAVARAAST